MNELSRRLEKVEAENKRLRQGLELTRMSVVLIMAHPGCDLSLDREAKLTALEEIDAALAETQEEK